MIYFRACTYIHTYVYVRTRIQGIYVYTLIVHYLVLHFAVLLEHKIKSLYNNNIFQKAFTYVRRIVRMYICMRITYKVLPNYQTVLKLRTL